MPSPLEVFRDDAMVGRVVLVTGGGTGICRGIAAADVRDPDAIGRAVRATVERFGKLDTLVNGAAGNFLAPAAALSPNGFRTVIDIDLNGTFNAARAAFEALKTAG